MKLDFLAFTLISGAVLVIVCLAYYAGKLLYLVHKQNQKATINRHQRIERIVESVQTIAKAVEQRQCNLSEASIRLYHLLESLPVIDKPNYVDHYPGIYELNIRVSNLPTHQARQQLSRAELNGQDAKREASEAELENQIMHEVTKLKAFTVH